MDYADMLRDGASHTEMREYLVGGEMTAVTIRIPRNLRDSAKKAASLRGHELFRANQGMHDR